MKKHPTKNITLKTADIDLEMIPVVKWLNKFQSVTTKWCCQGSNKPYDTPYVVFSCDQSLELLTIVERIGYTGAVEIRPPLGIRTLDYCIRFPNRRNFKVFKNGLK
jgi:hypothetical protein